MTAEPAPAADLDIDEGELRRALRVVEPTSATLPLRRISNGWDNEMWRLGDELAVRVARRTSALELLTAECHWLPHLPDLGVAVPAPRWHARPDAEGHVRWAVVPWFEGTDLLGRTGGADLADALGAALARLHVPAPAELPTNPVRGVPLATRLPRTVTDLEAIDRGELVDEASRVARSLPSPPTRRWSHGDVHPGNLVIDGDGRLVALIDFGDLGAGDEANDLAAAWLLFDEPERRRFVDRYERDRIDPIDDGLWDRAEWWALAFCAAVLRTAPSGPLADRCRVVLAELAPTFRR